MDSNPSSSGLITVLVLAVFQLDCSLQDGQFSDARVWVARTVVIEMMKLFHVCLKHCLKNEKRVFKVTDAAGCSLSWNESTHYVRAIAVFKISLTLCVSICRAFGQIGKGKPRGRREDWLVVIYKHCALWLPFPRVKHKKLVTRCFLFSCLHLVCGFLACTHTHTHKRRHSKSVSTAAFLSLFVARPPLSLFQIVLETHLQSMHTHTQALLGYWTAKTVRSLL